MNQLLNEFPPVSIEEWERLIEKDLKGQDYEKKLVWKTEEGFAVQPYYAEEHLGNRKVANPPGMPSGWAVIDGITNSDHKSALESIRKSLESGAEGLVIRSYWKGTSVSGVVLKDEASIRKFMEDVLETAKETVSSKNSNTNGRVLHIYWETGSLSLPYVRAFQQVLSAKAEELPFQIQGGVFQDPLSDLLVSGRLSTSREQMVAQLCDSVRDSKNSDLRSIGINGNIFSETGSNLTQEIAFTLAIASDYLSLLTENGIPAKNAADQILFRMAVGSNYFHEIAKFRAIRFLWNQILQAYGIADSDRKCRIYAETSSWNTNLFDPHVNMIRVTTEAMSAVLGGVNALQVLPFDSSYKDADDFSKRIARNCQLLLRHESYLDKVVDPSSGSYYIDHLTYTFTENAWKLFQEIEELGGYTQALQKGTIQKMVQEVSQVKKSAILSKKDPILGTSQYPNPLDKPPVSAKSEFVSVVPDSFQAYRGTSDLSVDTVPVWRKSEDFDRLRKQVEDLAQNGSPKPQVALLATGNRGMRTARASFATNFFGVAGFGIVNPGAFDDPAQALDAVIAAKPAIVVLCSSDEEYLGLVQSLGEKIRTALPKTKLVVAGNPEGTDELKKLGVDSFIHARSHLFDTLQKYVADSL